MIVLDVTCGDQEPYKVEAGADFANMMMVIDMDHPNKTLYKEIMPIDQMDQELREHLNAKGFQIG